VLGPFACFFTITVSSMTRQILGVFFAAMAVLLVGAGQLDAQVDHLHPGPSVQCSTIAIDGDAGCTVEDYLLSLLASEGVAAAMAALDSLAAAADDIRREGHGYAHAIGITAYTGDEEVGTVFSRCTPAFQSGCFHGVIQAYFTQHMREHGDHLDAATVNALCRTQREGTADRWLLFQCAHGMGHGMVMIAGNHLPTALEGCDLVDFDWERESCYGGVFMENIVHETMPHHATGRPETVDQSAHSQHSPDSHAAAPIAARDEFPPLKRDEPLYPCTVLAERYRTACYQMQTSAVLHFNGSDVRAAAGVCASAPEDYRSICFQSLGRDISSITLQDHARAMRLCSTAPVDYQPWCTIGYTKNLVDVTADPADGFAYCRLLPAGESKRVCNVAVGEQIWVLAEEPERREEMCLGAEPDFVAACRHGAGLTELDNSQAAAAVTGLATPPE
jgi:hypothetical protein